MTRGSLTRMLAVVALWIATPALTQQANSAALAFQPPLEVAGFRMMGHEVLAPGAGARLRYQRPGDDDWIDVYVYPAGADSGCARACDSVAMEREVADFAPMIPELVSRGYYDSLRVAADDRVSLAAGGRTLRGHHLHLQGGRGGRRVTSQFYLVGAGDVLVKVRATYAPDASMDSAVEAFTVAFVPALRLGGNCPGGQPQGNGISMRGTLETQLSAVRARVPEALGRLGYQLEPDTGPDTWVTLPVRAWPDRELWGMMKASPHPGVQIQVRAGDQGGKTELTVSARPLCGVPEHRDVESSVALIAAMEIMNELTGAAK
jgi:hypothetical protein